MQWGQRNSWWLRTAYVFPRRNAEFVAWHTVTQTGSVCASISLDFPSFWLPKKKLSASRSSNGVKIVFQQGADTQWFPLFYLNLLLFPCAYTARRGWESSPGSVLLRRPLFNRRHTRGTTRGVMPFAEFSLTSGHFFCEECYFLSRNDVVTLCDWFWCFLPRGWG